MNPNDTEWFDLLGWWISGTSEQIVVEFGDQKIEGPSSSWDIKLDLTWADGGSKVRALATSTAKKLEVVLVDP